MSDDSMDALRARVKELEENMTKLAMFSAQPLALLAAWDASKRDALDQLITTYDGMPLGSPRLMATIRSSADKMLSVLRTTSPYGDPPP